MRGDERTLLKHAQEDQALGWGFRHLPVSSWNETGNLNFVLLHHMNFMLVIFPGSKMLENWTTDRGNLNVRKINFLHGRIHEGFWYQVDSYWTHLVSLLDGRPGTPVVFAGYSRGGTCALISALRFRAERGKVRIGAIITVGQPMCVDSNLARKINHWRPREYIRIVTSNDVIPLAPSNFIDYAHAGVMWFYNKSGKLWINPSEEVINAAIRQDNSLLQPHDSPLGFLLAIPDQVEELKKGHSLTNYRYQVYGNEEMYGPSAGGPYGWTRAGERGPGSYYF